VVEVERRVVEHIVLVELGSKKLILSVVIMVVTLIRMELACCDADLGTLRVDGVGEVSARERWIHSVLVILGFSWGRCHSWHVHVCYLA